MVEIRKYKGTSMRTKDRTMVIRAEMLLDKWPLLTIK
jgi:hypothetical protein